MRKFMLAVGALGVLICVLSCGPYRPVDGDSPNEGIVDMHCHVAGIGAGGSGCFISYEFRENWRYKFFLKGFGVTEDELWEKGDDLVVDRLSKLLSESKFVKKAVVLAMDGVVTEGVLNTALTQVYVPNDFVADVVAKHNNLLFGASINPYRRDALERLVRAHGRGAVLVKWIPSIMNINPSDPKIRPFYEKMKELNLPLLTHTGYDKSFPHANHDLADPELLDLPLSMGVTVIAAHIASMGTYDGEESKVRLHWMMTKYNNLYVDISALTQLDRPGAMREALTWKEFLNRSYYGSDFPLINGILVSPWYQIHRLLPRKIREISSLSNPWDRDVKIKHLLGTPKNVFTRSQDLLEREIK